MCALLTDQLIYGLQFSGKRHDIGNKLDFLKTNIEFGLKRSEIAAELHAFLGSITTETDH